jgi:hypothetical protein
MLPFISYTWWKKAIYRLADNDNYRRVALSPDGTTLAFLELGPPKKLVFQSTEDCCSTGAESNEEHGSLRCVLLSGDSRFLPGTMAFHGTNDNKYMLVLFRYTEASGRLLKSTCRTLVVNTIGGYCITSFFHSENYREANGRRQNTSDIRGTSVTFAPNEPVIVSSLPCGLSFKSIDFEMLERQRDHLMNMPLIKLKQAIGDQLRQNPPSSFSEQNTIVDWIIQFHDQQVFGSLIQTTI